MKMKVIECTDSPEKESLEQCPFSTVYIAFNMKLLGFFGQFDQ
jgi:hypothetical protein